MEHQELVQDLAALASALISEVTRTVPGAREGTVMTIGPVPYRRIDADGRALAYVRVRPKRRAVRVDVSGLWQASSPSRLRCPAAGGAATLLVERREQLPEALRFLQRCVEETRAAREAALALPSAA